MVTPATSLPIPNLGGNDPGPGASQTREGTSDVNPTDFATALVQAQSQRPVPLPARSAANPNAASTAVPVTDPEPQTSTATSTDPAPTAETAPPDANGKEATLPDDVPTPAQPTGNAVALPPITYSMLVVGLAMTVPVAATKETGGEPIPSTGNATPWGNTAAPVNVQPLVPSLNASGPSAAIALPQASPVSPLPTTPVTAQSTPAANNASSPSNPLMPFGAPMDSNAPLSVASRVDHAIAPILTQPVLSENNPAGKVQPPALPESPLANQAAPTETPTAAPLPLPITVINSPSPAVTPAPAIATPISVATPSPTLAVGVNIATPAPAFLPTPVAVVNAATPTPTAVTVPEAATPTPSTVVAGNMVTSALAAVSATVAVSAAPTPVTAGNQTLSQTNGTPALETPKVANPTTQTGTTPVAIAATTVSARPQAQPETQTPSGAAQRIDTLERLQIVGQPVRPEILRAQSGTATHTEIPAPESASTASSPILPIPARVQPLSEQPMVDAQAKVTPTAAPVTTASTAKNATPLPIATSTEIVSQPTASVTLPALNALLNEQTLPAVASKSGVNNLDTPALPLPGNTTLSTATATVTAPVASQNSATTDSHEDASQQEERSSEPSHAAGETAATSASVPDVQRPAQNAANAVAPVSRESHATSSEERIRIVEQVTRHIESLRMPAGSSEMSLRLRPEHLGSLHLTITSQSDGVIARIVAETSQVQQALESHKENLRAALEGRGLRLNTLDVSVGQQSVPDGRTGFASQQNPAQQGPLPPAWRTNVLNAPAEAAVTPITRPIGLDPSTSRLDYRA